MGWHLADVISREDGGSEAEAAGVGTEQPNGVLEQDGGTGLAANMMLTETPILV